MADRPELTAEPTPAPARRPRMRQRLRSPQETRQWRRRMAGYAVIGVSFILVVNALVGENGYLATMRARREKADLTAEIRRVRTENQQMKDQIRRLQDDPTALEEAARRELRLGKPGETMVVIKDKVPARTPPAPPK